MSKILVLFEKDHRPDEIRNGDLSHLNETEVTFIHLDSDTLSDDITSMNPRNISFDNTSPEKTSEVCSTISNLKIPAQRFYVSQNRSRSFEKTRRVDSFQNIPL